jgi:ASC-1-like (ASCH) protein
VAPGVDMATYDAQLYPEAFVQMEARKKTVYALPASPEYRHMCSGDRLEFGSFGSITVGMVRKYESLEALVNTEGWQCLVPEAEGQEAAVEMVRSVPEWDAEMETEHGVIALRVRDVRRKS